MNLSLTDRRQSHVGERVFAQLLIELDGGVERSNNNNIKIIAATNQRDLVDKVSSSSTGSSSSSNSSSSSAPVDLCMTQELTRPGRLDRRIYVPLPDEQTQRDM